MRFFHILYIIFIALLYEILSFFTLPLLIPYLLWRSYIKKPIFGNFFHRIGFIPLSPKNKKIIWFHAVSAGEVLSLEYIIKHIQKQTNNHHCYLTVGTLAGYLLAQKNYPNITIAYIPYDYIPCIILGISRIKPAYCILVEAEIWPNLIYTNYCKNIPMYLINARIHKKKWIQSLPYYLLIQPLYCFFKKIYTQDHATTQTLQTIPQITTDIIEAGTTKIITVVYKIEQSKKNTSPQRLPYMILLVGSCHPQEFLYYLTLFNACKKQFSSCKLIIVPRHMHWQKQFDITAQQCDVTFFSSNQKHTPEDSMNMLHTYDVIGLFTMGILFELYCYATIFYLGGTWVPVGGHNLLEPAAWGIPTIIGPHNFSCKEIVSELIENNAIMCAKNHSDLLKQTLYLLASSAKQDAMRQSLHNWIMNKNNLSKKNFDLFINHLINTI